MTSGVTSVEGGQHGGVAREDRLAWLVAAVLVVVSFVALVRLTEPVRLTFDEWVFLTDRHRWTWGSVFEAHNGHPVMLPALAYLIGFHTVGLDVSWYYRVVLIVAHLGVCAVLAGHVWRRHGVLPAVCAWFVVGFMGAGATNIVWPFQVSLVGSVLFFLLAIDALTRLRQSGDRRTAVTATAFVILSLAFSAVGLATAATVAIVVVADRTLRRWWWVPTIPLGLFAVWWLAYSEPQETSRDVGALVGVLWESAYRAGAALAGGNDVLGAVLVLAVFAYAVVNLIRRRLDCLSVAGLIFVLTFWALTASSRTWLRVELSQPSPPRYQYVAVVGIVLAVSDMVPKAVARWRQPARLACVAVAVTSVWAGYSSLIAERDLIARYGLVNATQLAVVDEHPHALPGDMALFTVLGEPRMTVDGYETASEHLRSGAGLDPEEFAALSPTERGWAEALILPLLEVTERSSVTCAADGQPTSSIELDAGESVDVETSDDVRVVASRWSDPRGSGPGAHRLNTGSYRLTTPADGLTGSWRFDFGRPVQRLDCG